VRFRGNFTATIDSQGRLKIPTAHKAIFDELYGADVYITSLNGDRVIVYPIPIWESIEEKLSYVSDGVKDKFMDMTGYWGQQTTMDKLGRIQIQPRLRKKAGVDGEVAVIGQMDRLVIWAIEALEQRIEANPFTDDDRKELAKLGV
jgi:MraZ protein